MNAIVFTILLILSLSQCLYARTGETSLLDTKSPEFSLSQLKLKGEWSMSEGNIVYRSSDWWWDSAAVDLPVNNYELDAVVSITPTASGKNNCAGFVFRKTETSAAAFYIWQPLGGYAAQAEILGDCKHWSKEVTYALSKDTEKGDHHLRALVKDNLANFYVDGQLTCILDLTDCPKGSAGMYAHHDVVFKSFIIRDLPANAKLVRTRPVRSLLYQDKIHPGRQDWRKVVAKCAAVLDEAVKEGTEGVPGEESMPAYTYRCVNYMKPGVRPIYAYPAFHHALIIDGLLHYYDYSKDRKYLKEAIKLARWEIEHSTPSTDKLPYLPYSTTYDGKMGGNCDGDTVMLDKPGIMGSMYLKLWRMTGDGIFKEAAIKMAETLLSVQLPEGRWQNRVEHATGKVTQDYTSNQMFNIVLMDELFEITGDKRFAESSKKALNWVLDNPVRTGRWTGYYEDVAANVQSIGNWDAIETARYLAAHKNGNPKYLELAIDISNWVGTSFAVKQNGMWPAVCEQSVCMPVMSGHTMHYALLLNELYKATGNEYYHKAAVSTANTGFDIATGDEQWYSLISTPLFFGLDLARELNLP